MSARSDLELAASQALYAARLLEAAVHDDGPWAMRWGTIEVPATRRITEDGVVFEATFPDACYLADPGPHLLLLCRGEILGLRVMDHPGDTQFAVLWSLAALRPAV